MRMTVALKQWLIANCGVKSEADDDTFRKAAGDAFASGRLTAERYTELAADPDTEKANTLMERFDAIADGIEKLTEAMKTKEAEAKAKGVKTEEKKAEAKEVKTEKVQLSNMAKMVARMGGTPVEPDDENKSFDIRVKEAAEQYSTTKTALLYPTHTKSGRGHSLAGQRVVDFSEKGRALDEPSDRDRAVAGAYCKFMCATAQRHGSRTFGFQSLPQHDKELLCYALENMEWNGASDGGMHADIINRRLLPGEQKALIDDATSGGLEAAPIVFDDMVIQTPLLYGELFPLVNTVPIDRGRRIEGVATGTVTGSWGGVDDTAVSLFTTTSYVSAFDTTIFRWQGSIRIGLDFLSDSPIDFGAHVTAQYGERLLEDLDDVIATGNGTTQPEGVMNKSGVTSVAFGAATSIGAYESLRFGVTKAEHRPNVASSAVFCGTETSYQRALAIAVGASDYRRLSNTISMPNYDGYNWMQRPYKINSSLTNAQIFYAILGRYRMYRRRGLSIVTSREGDTLVRNNEMLIVAMARYGGQLERAACAALTTTAPA